jgi:hypothetical protein
MQHVQLQIIHSSPAKRPWPLCYVPRQTACAYTLVHCGSAARAPADLEQRVVASHLAGLWREHGPDSWRAVTLDGAPVAVALSLGWHADKLPSRGVLCFEFHSDVAVGDTAVHLDAERAAGILLGFSSDGVSDLWRLSYLKVLVACFFLPGVQAAQARHLLLCRL